MSFFDNWQEKRRLKRIRKNMFLLGYNLFDYSDEEVKKAVLKIAEIIRQSGVSAKTMLETEVI